MSCGSKQIILQGPAHDKLMIHIASIFNKKLQQIVKPVNSNSLTTSFITWFQMLFHILALFGLIYAQRRSHMCIQSYILSHFQM